MQGILLYLNGKKMYVVIIGDLKYSCESGYFPMRLFSEIGVDTCEFKRKVLLVIHWIL